MIMGKYIPAVCLTLKIKFASLLQHKADNESYPELQKDFGVDYQAAIGIDWEKNDGLHSEYELTNSEIGINSVLTKQTCGYLEDRGYDQFCSQTFKCVLLRSIESTDNKSIHKWNFADEYQFYLYIQESFGSWSDETYKYDYIEYEENLYHLQNLFEYQQCKWVLVQSNASSENTVLWDKIVSNSDALGLEYPLKTVSTLDAPKIYLDGSN